MKDSSVDLCPVPKEQQPVNEYEQLKDSWFFRWATLDIMAYSRKLIWVWLWSWLVIGPIAAASFSPQKHPLHFALSGILASTIFLGLVLLRLYLGWMYIYDRLKIDKVFYEESGWYDGQIWIKTTEELTRDRLIVSYQIAPILVRLKKTSLILVVLIAMGGFLGFIF